MVPDFAAFTMRYAQWLSGDLSSAESFAGLDVNEDGALSAAEMTRIGDVLDSSRLRKAVEPMSHAVNTAAPAGRGEM